MASIERTAYPRFPRILTLKDLQASFTPKPEEIEWAQQQSRTPQRRLALLVLLKCFEFLRHFPALDAIPAEVVENISATLGVAPTDKIEFASLATLYRHHKVIRELLGVKPYTDGQTRRLAIQIAQQVANVVETRVDIINITIEELVRLGYELPVFRTLDEISEQAHSAAEAALNARINQRLSSAQRTWLDRLLESELPARRTLYNQIKKSAKKASRKHLDLLLDQLTWLESLPDSDALLDGIPVTKLNYMAGMASALDAGDMKDLLPAKRYTLILALIRQMRVRARDDVAEMFIRRIGAIHRTAREELQVIQARQRELSEELVATLEQVLEILAENLDDASTGQRVRDLLAPHGSLDQLTMDCEAIRVWSGGNHLPLVWKAFSSWRAAMFRMAKALRFEAATQDRSLLDERYLLTVFAMGCNLGPNQAARHLSNGVTPHQLSYANQRHMSLDQLDNACRDLTELYLRLELPKLWGEGKKVAADGTQHDFYDQNLLVGMHFRYRRMGAVAYRHVADNYIAVFRHFIPPGVLEAVYVIEGLMKAGLSVQADTVYSDTHGQSETVFAFTHLPGIQLMPRIRNWKDLRFYRPEKGMRFRHIDRLFSDVVDWKLIRDHWRDLMQVSISIQAGKIASPMLLRKLSQEGRHNRLFAAARELGRVLRTVYLLRWISSKEMRQEVSATTNKIESYHAFTKWLDFGGDVINENDPNEQQKRVRFIDLVASSVILQNTVDMMRVLQEMYADGEPVSAADVEYLSPYMTSGIKRFGNYHLDLKRPPEPWVKESQFREAAKRARAAAAAVAAEGQRAGQKGAGA